MGMGTGHYFAYHLFCIKPTPLLTARQQAPPHPLPQASHEEVAALVKHRIGRWRRLRCGQLALNLGVRDA